MLAALQPNSHSSSGLLFNDRHPRNPCNYKDYYPFTDPEGMKGRVAWLVDPWQTLYPQSGHMSSIDQA